MAYIRDRKVTTLTDTCSDSNTGKVTSQSIEHKIIVVCGGSGTMLHFIKEMLQKMWLSQPFSRGREKSHILTSNDTSIEAYSRILVSRYIWEYLEISHENTILRNPERTLQVAPCRQNRQNEAYAGISTDSTDMQRYVICLSVRICYLPKCKYLERTRIATDSKDMLGYLIYSSLYRSISGNIKGYLRISRDFSGEHYPPKPLCLHSSLISLHGRSGPLPKDFYGYLRTSRDITRLPWISKDVWDYYLVMSHDIYTYPVPCSDNWHWQNV